MGLFSSLSFRKRSQEPALVASPQLVSDAPLATEAVASAEATVAEAEAEAEPTAPAPALEAAPAPVAAVEVAPAAVVAPAPAPVAAAPAPSAAERAQAEELVRRVANELPTFITVAVVEAATGKILAGQWAGNSGGAVEVALANAEIVRQTHLAIEALQLTATEQLADILITLRYQLHLVRVLPQRGWLLYLAVHTKDTNLALARSIAQLFDE